MSNSDSIVSEATASAEKSLLDGVPLSADIAAIIPSAKLGVEGEKEDAAEPEDEQGKKEDADFNSVAFTYCFFGDETSFSLKIGGQEQMFARKKFQHGPHRCFLDLEALSKLPKLFNYFVLSAVAMDKENKVFYCKCYIQHKVTGKRYLLLAILRSKCIKIRYDFVLCDEENDNEVTLLAGISKMGPYNFLPDEEVDFDASRDILARFLCSPKTKLALIEGQADKDEYGNLISSGDFDPLQLGLSGSGARKRSRKQTLKFSEDDSNPSPAKKAKAKKQGLRGKPKLPPKRKVCTIIMY